MYFSILFAFLLPLLALASPRPQISTSSTTCLETSQSYSSTATVTTSATRTVTPSATSTTSPSWNSTSSTSSTSSASSTTAGSIITFPTAAFRVTAFRDESTIDLRSVSASGYRLFVGGNTASYCPSEFDGAPNDCPPGNELVFYGVCSLDVEVPAGQQVWARPDGTIGYTQAHSLQHPSDSILCPFSYRKDDSDRFGVLDTDSFGASGLMGCPTGDGRWQVFAAVPNATVPSGNINDCVGFKAVTDDYPGTGSAAWEYI